MIPAAIATCADLPDLDDEGRLLAAALRQQGIHAIPQIWDDPGVSWDRYQRVIIRSTWDWWRSPPRFAGWVRQRGPALLNPPRAVLWNLAKHCYLPELAAAGVPVVPSEYVRPGEFCRWPNGPVVVKLSIGAGGHAAAVHHDRQAAVAHAADLHARGHVIIIQPWLAGAVETDVVFIAGQLSHCVRKAALLTPGQPPHAELWQEDRVTACVPDSDVIGTAVCALQAARALAGDLLYARVDILRDQSGRLHVIEVEVTEPSLFFPGPAAADVMAHAIARHLHAPGR